MLRLRDSIVGDDEDVVVGVGAMKGSDTNKRRTRSLSALPLT